MANAVYINEGTPLVWDAAGTDESLTLTSLGAGTGRNGALHDFGVAARAVDWVWRLRVKFATQPVVGEKLHVYWRTSDGTYADNDDGGDVALSHEDKLRNLKLIGMLEVDEATASPSSVTFVASGYLPPQYAAHRYGGPVVWNDTADDLSSTSADHSFILTPVPPELQ